MRILKLLNKFLIILIGYSFFVNSAISNEPVDIWNIEKKQNVIEKKLLKDEENINDENVKVIGIIISSQGTIIFKLVI